MTDDIDSTQVSEGVDERDSDSTDELLVTFYGDDFTGSTDVMESLSMNGVRTALFFDPPTADELSQFDDVQAVGVAGTSRSMSPDAMDQALPPIFEALETLDAELFHYKVCSTFDSAPEIGSIGHAADIGSAIFESKTIPLIIAAPDLHPRGRYVVFGNLFATVDGVTYRLDRHPTMQDHPVTPMSEADVRQHLGQQTDQRIGLVDILELEGMADRSAATAFERAAEGNDIVAFDTVRPDHQQQVGELVWAYCREQPGTTFAVGSSGLEYALTDHWHASGRLTETSPPEPRPTVDSLIVMSGSASPVTAGQIEWALERDFEGVRLDTSRLIDPDHREAARAAAREAAIDVIDRGHSVILYAARGPDDEAIERTRTRAAELGLDDVDVGRRLGTQQGRILRDLLLETGHRRVCVAGGDTSGYVAPELDLRALEMLVPLAPGSPLCQAHASDERFDGLEVALKGGQVGRPNYFGLVRNGGAQADR